MGGRAPTPTCKQFNYVFVHFGMRSDVAQLRVTPCKLNSIHNRLATHVHRTSTEVMLRNAILKQLEFCEAGHAFTFP
eukprot:256980-Amphidinium_carterae.2